MTTDDADDLDSVLAAIDERQVRASVALVTLGDSNPAAQPGGSSPSTVTAACASRHWTSS